MIDNTKEYILCAAIKRIKPRKHKNGCPYWDDKNDIMSIEIGYRHHDIYQRFNNHWLIRFLYKIHLNWNWFLNLRSKIVMKLYVLDIHNDGFYTSRGRFVDRYEGMKIAYNAGQVSENVALSKSWYSILVNMTDTDGNVVDEKYLKEHDKHKFNMLFSEDLY